MWLHRQHRLGAIQRLDLRLFVDTEHDRVLGWVQIQPDKVGDLSDQLGSVENLNVSARQGWMPYSRHALATAEKLIPKCLASSRELQCVTPSFFGGGVSVAVTISP
jgi:hypothetical protein